MDGLKKHLLSHLTKSMAYEATLGNQDLDLSQHHSALADAHDGEAAECHRKIAECHKARARTHADHAEHLAELHKAIETGGDELWPVPSHEDRRGRGGDLDGGSIRDFAAAVPTAVKGVARENPTLVPRFGGPDGNAPDLDKVPQEHKHLIRTA